MKTFVQHKPLVMLSVLFAVLGGLVLLGILPLHQGVEETAKTLEAERVKAAVAQYQQQNALLSKNEYENLRPTTERFNTFFVSEQGIVDFISALERIATDAGISQEISNLRPTDSKNQSTIQLTMEGSFSGFFRYLEGLEASPYYIASNRLTIRRSQTDAPLQMTIQATIFWL